MKVCPECGFIDRSHWRQNRWRTNVEFLNYRDYPEDIDLEVLDQLKEGHPFVCDKLYAYRISSRVVERVLKCDFEQGGKSTFHIPREKVPSRDPWQETLKE